VNVRSLDVPDAGPALPGGPARGAPAPSRGRALIAVATVAGAALAGGLVWAVTPGGASGVATVRITAHHSRFEPDRITVKPGSTVRFVVHNGDPIDHEFIIGPPEVHELHERGTPHVHTGIVPGEITVPAGATLQTTWTFGPAGSPAVAYGCHLAGHWAYGMHGLATVG
jgi:uncharacterized cupredoxin-like copper-binding protein